MALGAHERTLRPMLVTDGSRRRALAQCSRSHALQRLGRGRRALIGVLLSGAAFACGPGAGTYCQTGNRYGTECYSRADVESPPGAPGRPADGESRPDWRGSLSPSRTVPPPPAKLPPPVVVSSTKPLSEGRTGAGGGSAGTGPALPSPPPTPSHSPAPSQRPPAPND